MEKVIHYHGEYKGICYEIKNWSFPSTLSTPSKEHWSSYITIYLNGLPGNLRKKFWLKGKKNKTGTYIDYGYSFAPILSDLPFHGGITYYEKLGGIDDKSRRIKIGCDYLHYWDEGRHYDELSVELDIKEVIDDFLRIVPTYKRKYE